MTLHVVCRNGKPESVIELHGFLGGAEVAEFLGACTGRALPLRIELGNLRGVSEDGLLALKGQRARGARLTGASPYIDLLLRGASGEGDG